MICMIHTGNMDIFFQIPIDPYGVAKSFFFKQVLKLFLLKFRERQWTIL